MTLRSVARLLQPATTPMSARGSRDATVQEVEGFPVRVASIDHLIAMKRAANRPKDKLMLLEYIEFAGVQKQIQEKEED